MTGLTSLTGKANGAAKPEKATKPKATAPVSQAAPVKAAPAAAALAAPAAVAGKPQLYASPPADGVDDLKQISGVGPKLEKLLNSLGIYTFGQVAAWSADDVAWVDARLTFKGRIERDDWMSQAKALAAGGKG